MEKEIIESIVRKPPLSVMDEHNNVVIWDVDYITDDNIERVVNDGCVNVKFSPRKGKTKVFEDVPVTFEALTERKSEENITKATVSYILSSLANKARAGVL